MHRFMCNIIKIIKIIKIVPTVLTFKLCVLAMLLGNYNSSTMYKYGNQEQNKCPNE